MLRFCLEVDVTHHQDRRRAKAARDATAPALLKADDPVGTRLRAMFESVEASPVPDEIKQLVQELEQRRRRRSPKTN